MVRVAYMNFGLLFTINDVHQYEQKQTEADI